MLVIAIRQLCLDCGTLAPGQTVELDHELALNLEARGLVSPVQISAPVSVAVTRQKKLVTKIETK